MPAVQIGLKPLLVSGSTSDNLRIAPLIGPHHLTSLNQVVGPTG